MRYLEVNDEVVWWCCISPRERLAMIYNICPGPPETPPVSVLLDAVIHDNDHLAIEQVARLHNRPNLRDIRKQFEMMSSLSANFTDFCFPGYASSFVVSSLSGYNLLLPVIG